MTLGEKLRQARLKLGLSQAQVAGDKMTRNMLSQLENDVASPSVRSLQYLARTLEVSVSWLLEEDGDADSASCREAAKGCFGRGDYRGCMELLCGLEPPLSQEDSLLLHRSALACAGRCLNEGNAAHGAELLAVAGRCQSVYLLDLDREAEALLLLRCRLLLGQPDDQLLEQVCRRAHSREAEGLAAEHDLLKGRLAVDAACFAEALPHLHRAEDSGCLSPSRRQQLYRLLELCYKQQENYRQAYHYAALRLENR